MAKVGTLPERQRGTCCALPRPLGAKKVADRTAVLKALADPTRLEMALMLRAARDPVCVCDLTATFDLSQPTVSHHIARLRTAGLVEATRRGVWSYYRLRADLPAEVHRLLDALA